MNILFIIPLALFIILQSASAQSNDMVWMKGGHAGAVLSAAISPDETLLASASDDGTIKLWEISTGRYLGSLKGYATSVVFLPDGRLISGSSDGTLHFWDVQTRQLQRVLQDSAAISHLLLAPDGSRLIAGRTDGTIRIRDLNADTIIATVTAHPDSSRTWDGSSISAFALSPDGMALVSGSAVYDTLKLWDATTGALRLTILAHEDGISAATFSPDGKRVVSGTFDSYVGDTVKVWDVESGVLIKSFVIVPGSNKKAPRAFSFISNDSLIVASEDALRIWDVGSVQLLDTYPYSNSPNGPMVLAWNTQPTVIVFASQRKFLLAGMRQAPAMITHSGINQMLEVRDIGSGMILRRFLDFVKIGGMAFKGMTSTLMTIEWKLETYGIVNRYIPSDSVRVSWGGDRVGVSPDGMYGANVSLTEGSEYGTLWMDGVGIISPMFPGSLLILAPSPAGKYLGYCQYDPTNYTYGTFYLWNAATKETRQIAPKITGARFSYDARRIALLNTTGSILIWNTDLDRVEWTIPPDTARYTSFAFSYDGTTLATTHRDSGRITLWDLQSQSKVQQLNGHRGTVNAVAFSRNDRYLVSAGADSTVRTWIPGSGSNDYTYTEYPASHLHVAVSPDSKYIVSSTADGALILWNARGAIASVESEKLTAHSSTLRCYPTPSNSLVTIECELALSGIVDIRIVDQLGREVERVADGELQPGTHRFTWDAQSLPAGIYHCRLLTSHETVTVPIVLVH